MDEEIPEIFHSPLCRKITADGHTVRVEIYSTGKNDWVLEVVDAWNTSTVWDGVFETDELALEEFERTLKEEGIGCMSFPIAGRP